MLITLVGAMVGAGSMGRQPHSEAQVLDREVPELAHVGRAQPYDGVVLRVGTLQRFDCRAEPTVHS